MKNCSRQTIKDQQSKYVWRTSDENTEIDDTNDAQVLKIVSTNAENENDEVQVQVQVQRIMTNIQ